MKKKKKKEPKQDTTKITIVVDSPEGIFTYKCSNVQVTNKIENHFEWHRQAPWMDYDMVRIETRPPTFTLTVQPLGVKSASGDGYTMEFKKK